MGRRRLLVSLGLGAASVGACLVFDGRVADAPIDAGDAGQREDASTSKPSTVGCGTDFTCMTLEQKCCTKPGFAGWGSKPGMGETPTCGTDEPGICMEAGGAYGYACDDLYDCFSAGKMCCAARNGTTGPFSSSGCEQSCAPPTPTTRPLCQPFHANPCPPVPQGLPPLVCVKSDASDLPPGYYECL